MVAALHRAKDKLIVPDNMELVKVTREQFDHMLQTETGKTYNTYGVWGAGLSPAPHPDDEWAYQREQMEQKLARIVEGVTWLTGSFLEQRDTELEEQGQSASNMVGAASFRLNGGYR